jgi:hypothetical protein
VQGSEIKPKKGRKEGKREEERGRERREEDTWRRQIMKGEENLFKNSGNKLFLILKTTTKRALKN